jgi:acyl-CoA thioesterase-1
MKRAVLFLGDSLTFGYLVPPGDSIPSRIERLLQEQGIQTTVINGGVPGDTVEMAARRVPFYFQRFPGIKTVVLFLGANDFLAGEDPASVEQDYRRLVEDLLLRNVRIRIVAFGPVPGINTIYQERFVAIFPAMARLAGTPLIPFPMTDIIGHRQYTLADGLHPNSEGYRLMTERFWSALKNDLIQT